MKAASVYIAKADDEAPALLLPFLCCLVFAPPPPNVLAVCSFSSVEKDYCSCSLWVRTLPSSSSPLSSSPFSQPPHACAYLFVRALAIDVPMTVSSELCGGGGVVYDRRGGERR